MIMRLEKNLRHLMVATDCPVLDDETDALAHKLRVCPKHHLVEQLHCKVELQAPSQKEERVGDMNDKFQVSQQQAACTCTCRKY